MSQPARYKTVDDLGINSSIIYANNQNELDKSFITESALMSSKTQIDSFAPSHSESSLLFGLYIKNKPWPLISPPPGYMKQNGKIFTFQAIPSLGNPEIYMQSIDKAKEFSEKNKDPEVAKQSAKIVAFGLILSEIDTNIAKLLGLRKQYQKA